MSRLKNIKKDGYTRFQHQEQYEHVGLEVTRLQDGEITRRCKEIMLGSRSHSRKVKDTSQSLKSKARNKCPCVIINKSFIFVTHSLFPVRISKGMERRFRDRGRGGNMKVVFEVSFCNPNFRACDHRVLRGGWWWWWWWLVVSVLFVVMVLIEELEVLIVELFVDLFVRLFVVVFVEEK
uniref:Uncharacterized protein n=1 Tax=Tanacetum cinerariifolium TaxID=118510 RepID=A0A6L2K2T1_TANCI|nr:hypothetical protein [Tanacetum cinerariifolium]